MRHGFKAEAKRLALELRAELDLTEQEPFDPWALAELYGTDVYQLGDVDCSPEALQHFSIERPTVFSGALVPVATGAVIIENDAHLPVRRRSTTSHEMAHVVLEHRFTATLVNERGCRSADRDQEAEATELAGEMLLPFIAAKTLARRRKSNEEAALQYGISVECARWRLDATGARLIAARQTQAYRRSRSIR